MCTRRLRLSLAHSVYETNLNTHPFLKHTQNEKKNVKTEQETAFNFGCSLLIKFIEALSVRQLYVYLLSFSFLVSILVSFFA